MKVTLYVQIVPTWESWRTRKPDRPDGVRIAKTTMRRPEQLEPNARLVKVELEVDASQFITEAVPVAAPEPTPIRAVS